MRRHERGDPIRDLYDKLVGLLDEHNILVIATIVDARGSTPRERWAKMLVLPDGTVHGTIGGGRLEKTVVEDSIKAMEDGEGCLKEYDLVEKDLGGIGAVCGGRTKVLIEVVKGPDRLLICGGGHIGQALARMATGLGMEVWVVDEREDFASPGRFPENTHVLQAIPSSREVGALVTPNTYIVLTTHGHAHDKEALRMMAPMGSSYIGMIASKRKVKKVLDELEKEGLDKETLSRVHTPIGLDIGAEGPSEIAISILAEIIHVRRRGRSSSLSLKG